VFEGVPTYPDGGRFWNMIEKHKVSIFYTAPTAIRSLIKIAEADANVHPARYDLSSLRILGTVGEPINPEAWIWYYEQVGGKRCPVVDTWWQTETGGHMIAPLPGATPLVPGSCTLPLPGIMAAIVDETGQDVPNGQGGILVVKRPWPAMLRTVWGDPERYKKSYFPAELGGKLYLAGDGSVRDKETGYFTIMGRIDDVLNVSGHRLGTMEIESALVANPIVAEAAVVGRPDDTTGEAVVAFVVLKRARPEGEEAAKLANELRAWVAKEIGPIAKPKDVRFGDNLPKTRSGKIMRRLLRSLAKGEEITQDISTLENPAILEQLAQTGLISMIGKAERGPVAIDAIKKHKAAYLMAVGGAAYLVSKAIRGAKVLAFEDLGMEAIYEFDVSDMPVTVAVDSTGTSVHQTGPKEWQAKIGKLPVVTA
jgi:acetyl-CoA synthetase